MDLDDALHTLASVAAMHPGLRLLIVHGSRSQGLQHAGSDWDLGYLADGAVDRAELTAALSQVLGSDDIDVVDLASTSALLRFRAARDGRCAYERTPGTFEDFILEATLFWCDAEPIIRRAQAAVLAELPDRHAEVR